MYKDYSSSSTKINNRKKGILILVKGPTQRLELHCLQKKSIQLILLKIINHCLGLHYNGASRYLFVNGTEIYKFKAKVSETVANLLCLGNISKYWLADNMKRTGLNGYVYDFSVDYDAIEVDDLLDIKK